MENENKRKGLWIPMELWTNKELIRIERLFFMEIDFLDGEQGCFASNGYFSEFFELTEVRCSQIIKGLREKGYIETEYEYDKNGRKKRTIRKTEKGFRFSRIFLNSKENEKPIYKPSNPTNPNNKSIKKKKDNPPIKLPKEYNQATRHWNSLKEKNGITFVHKITPDKPSKTLININKYLKYLQNGTFGKYCIVSPKFLDKNNITQEMLRTKYTMEQINEAIYISNFFYLEGFFFEDKTNVPKSFDKAIFNSHSNGSFFMWAMTYVLQGTEPKMIKEKRESGWKNHGIREEDGKHVLEMTACGTIIGYDPIEDKEKIEEILKEIG